MNDIYKVKLARKVIKTLKKLPLHIGVKLQAWIEGVGHSGLSEIRKTPGFHDEPLQGSRMGERSIRLSRSYRAIYIIEKNARVKCVEIIEVHKHEY